MILLVHMLFGALIGQKVVPVTLAIILAFLSHYLLDILPHIEYDIDKITSKNWRTAKPQIQSILIDFFSGLLLILLFSDKTLLVFACAFLAMIPDGLSVLELFWHNTGLKKHNYFHQQRIHFLKYKKISNIWRVGSQIIIVIMSLVLFRL